MVQWQDVCIECGRPGFDPRPTDISNVKSLHSAGYSVTSLMMMMMVMMMVMMIMKMMMMSAGGPGSILGRLISVT